MEKYSLERQEKVKKDFRWIERMATLMDSKYSIGGFKFGLDPLLNLIPIAGQTASLGFSMMLVLLMMKNGASSKVAVKMMLNVLLDAILGAIPLLGTVFDFFNKANKKNVKLLKEHYFEEKHQGSAKGILMFLFLSLFLIGIVIAYLLWIFGQWLFGLF